MQGLDFSRRHAAFHYSDFFETIPHIPQVTDRSSHVTGKDSPNRSEKMVMDMADIAGVFGVFMAGCNFTLGPGENGAIWSLSKSGSFMLGFLFNGSS